MYAAQTARTRTEAASAATAFLQDGFKQENIFIFVYDKEESRELVNKTNTGKVGVKEMGVSKTVGSLFKGRRSRIHDKLKSLGVPEEEASQYEEQIARGLIVVVAADLTNNE
ncbi:general stress protein [Domibacillus indicus]|uniref:general stress protein n=1 Tax=Domibacillus indicus TaxID=1437523 RepID=UPI000698DFEB|nr:general stress protein [Domibacillus indicus]